MRADVLRKCTVVTPDLLSPPFPHNDLFQTENEISTKISVYNVFGVAVKPSSYTILSHGKTSIKQNHFTSF